MPVACLSACQPAILSASLAETERQREEQRGAEKSRDEHGDVGAARGKSAGHRRSQLKVTWPFDFVTCHQLPCLTLHWGAPAIHRCFPLPLSLCRFRLSECLSVFFCLPLPLHLLSTSSFSFLSWGFMGEKWRCDFLEELRYNRLRSLFSSQLS